jgi:hypothetical protein
MAFERESALRLAPAGAMFRPVTTSTRSAALPFSTWMVSTPPERGWSSDWISRSIRGKFWRRSEMMIRPLAGTTDSTASGGSSGRMTSATSSGSAFIRPSTRVSNPPPAPLVRGSEDRPGAAAIGTMRSASAPSTMARPFSSSTLRKISNSASSEMSSGATTVTVPRTAGSRT